MTLTISRPRFMRALFPVNDGCYSGSSGVELLRAPVTLVEQYVAQELSRRSRWTMSALVEAVRGRLARAERGAGGGCNDLFIWSDHLWHAEAERTVSALEGDLFRLVAVPA